MEYRRLGKSGLLVSELSFGAWVTFSTQFGVREATELMAAAFDGGINFFDNAEAYAGGEAEVVMGQALQQLKWRRSDFVVSSKVFWGGDRPNNRGLSRKHVVEACHAALKRLQVDYLDLYFCHRPDRNTPIEETVRAMSDLIQQGKVLYWGTSEWSARAIMEAHGIARRYNLVPPTMEQPQYNMFVRERFEVEYDPLYDAIGLGTTIWSPLRSGVLTGKYSDGIPEDSRVNLPGYEWLKEMVTSPRGQAEIEKVGRLSTIAADIGIPMAHMAIAWCLKNPNVSTVITGASRLSQLQENLRAVATVPKLTEDVMTAIEAVLANKPKQPEF